MIAWWWLIVGVWLAFLLGFLAGRLRARYKRAETVTEVNRLLDFVYDAGFECGMQHERAMNFAEQQIEDAFTRAWNRAE